MKEKPEIIYFRESWWQSLISDAGSFVMLVGAMAVNHFYLGDSAVWAVLLFLSILVTFVAKGAGKGTDFHSMEELKKYIDDSLTK